MFSRWPREMRSRRVRRHLPHTSDSWLPAGGGRGGGDVSRLAGGQVSGTVILSVFVSVVNRDER